MTVLQRAALAAIIVAVVWLLVMSALSIFADGAIYHVEQPVRVVGVAGGSVILRFTRTSLFNMPAVCSREMVCSAQVFGLPSNDCPIEKGRFTLTVAFPIPQGAVNGECEMQGIVTYRPVGRLGPDLSHAWKSETFTIE